MPAYYNENDAYAAQWLRNLIAARHIADGDVDDRSITDVRADDLRGYTQCHFFAGIGGWSIALRLAGWSDDRHVWTGSCPCQPFSAAGAGKAADDKRHLWPSWFPLIAERNPAIVFGEQVEAAIGWGWIDAVFADLEGQGYACGATVLPACGVGAPHIRQRCWFVADAYGERAGRHAGNGASAQTQGNSKRLPNGIDAGNHSSARRTTRELANPNGGNASAEGLQRSGEHGQRTQDGRVVLGPDGLADIDDNADGIMADTASGGFGEFGDATWPRRGGHADGGNVVNFLAHAERNGGRPDQPQRGPQGREANGWAGAGWLACTDGKARPVEPGAFPLAHGIQRRTSKLRAYGNAIVPQVAAEFIGAAMEACP